MNNGQNYQTAIESAWKVMKRLRIGLMNLAFILIDRFVFGLKSPHKKKERTLIIRLDNIGDFILWINNLEALVSHLRSQNVLLLANHIWASLAQKLFSNIEIYPIDVSRFKTNPFYRYRILSQLFQEEYAQIINPIYSRHLDILVAEILVKTLRASKKIGFGHAPLRGWHKWLRRGHLWTRRGRSEIRPRTPSR